MPTIVKTKAEEAYAAAFDGVAGQLPGQARFGAAREAAIKHFRETGLPHRRIEEWKYTDLRSAIKDAPAPAIVPTNVKSLTLEAVDAALGPLAGLEADRAVFVDGAFNQELSSLADQAGVTVSPLRAALENATGSTLLRDVQVEGAVGALNTAFVTDGAIVNVADGTRLARPLLLVFVRAGDGNALLTTRNVLTIGAKAEADIIEAYVSTAGASGGQSNALSQVTVGDGAQVSHIKVGVERDATHLATWTVTVGGDAAYNAFQFTADMALVRNQVFADYSGEGGKLDISGTFLGRCKEHIDTTLVVTHEVPGCESRELFKGVLDDSARGIFQGKVIVQPEAQKTDGKQMAQALMLSEACEFDSKPELEIYADDVACGHGSTCAELDPDLIFYCRSRGIPEDVARGLLIESFVAEAIAQIDNPAIAEALDEMARAWLNGKTK